MSIYYRQTLPLSEVKKLAKKPASPFGPGWVYVTVVMRTTDGVQTQSQLWKNKKTGEQRWHKL